MAASVVLTGLSANDPVPGHYVEALFAQGLSGGYQGPRPMLLIGNKTASGGATADTVVYGPDTATPCQSEQDVISLFGTGSPLHRAWLKASNILKSTVPVYCISVTASAGTAATKTITLLNVPASGGSWRVWVGAEFVDVGFASGDSLATITANAVTLINANTRWAVTAAQSTTTTTSDSILLTAKVAGPRGNWLRGMAAIIPGSSGTAVGTTTTNTADSFFAGGATADTNATAIATIAARRFYYIVSEAEDATQMGALTTAVLNQALPVTGIRQRVMCGSVDTASNVNTIATGLNAARAGIAWQKFGLLTPFELAAVTMATVALFENSGAKPMCNFSGLPRNDSERAVWTVPPQRDQTAFATRTDVKTALLNGVTPIATSANGQSTYIAKLITTKSLNGSNADYRVRDWHKPTVEDRFCDDLVQKLSEQMSGMNLVDDPKPGQKPVGGNTTSPARLRDLYITLIDDYGEAGDNLLQKTDQTKAAMIVQREGATPNRESGDLGLFICDILDTTATLVRQVG